MRRAPLALLALLFAACAASSPRYDGPIHDLHTHLVEGPGAEELNPKVPARPEVLLAQMDEARVERAGIITMAPLGDLPATRRQNDWILAVAAQHQERFFPIGSVHPYDGDEALAELERIAGLGVGVLKLHPNTQKFDVADPRVAALVKRAGELGVVVLFDGYSPFDADQLGKFVLLAVAAPGARIVLAHFGGPRFREMLVFAVLNLYAWYPRNVWFDLSWIGPTLADSPYKDELVWTVRKVGVDRVLFGSDFPLLGVAESVAAVRGLGFTREEQQRIFHDNLGELLRRQPGADLRDGR